MESDHILTDSHQTARLTNLRKHFFRFLGRTRRVFRRVIDRVKGGRWRRNRQAFIQDLLAHAETTPDFFFVQIGANDGRDVLHNLAKEGGWSGILVEPLPETFEALKRNYEDVGSQLIFENAAVSDHDGEVTMFVPVGPERDLRAHSNLASLRQRVKSLDSEEVRVRSLRFDTLLSKHGVSRIDLLIVDTEGYDLEILKAIDFDSIRPRYIQFEQLHLTPAGRWRSRALLREHGYRIVPMGNDTGAVLE